MDEQNLREAEAMETANKETATNVETKMESTLDLNRDEVILLMNEMLSVVVGVMDYCQGIDSYVEENEQSLCDDLAMSMGELCGKKSSNQVGERQTNRSEKEKRMAKKKMERKRTKQREVKCKGHHFDRVDD
jgi:hypothetical protein